MKKVDLSSMCEKWQSAVVSRTEVEKFTGGLVKPNYMLREKMKGNHPKSFKFGRKVGYLAVDLVEWIEQQSIVIE